MNNKAIGVLGDQPPIRSTRDLQDQVNFGCGATELYNSETVGVTADPTYYGQRSVRDQQMLQQFGCGGASASGLRLENYMSEKQKQAIQFANRNRQTQENYCGAVGSFAKTSDMPTNPWSNYASTVAMKPSQQ